MKHTTFDLSYEILTKIVYNTLFLTQIIQIDQNRMQHTTLDSINQLLTKTVYSSRLLTKVT